MLAQKSLDGGKGRDKMDTDLKKQLQKSKL
jgi:hypothetical protein